MENETDQMENEGKGTNDLMTGWLEALVEELDYPKIFIDISKDVVGYTYNSRKKALFFLTQKEADKLTRKGIVWRHMGEMWHVSATVPPTHRSRNRS